MVKVTLARSYRSKIEVLRDFLYAAREPVPKTRLIGMANLNPLAFQKYLRICTERGLIESVSGAYVATPRAAPLLEAIDELISKTSELELAFQALEGNPEAPGVRNGGNGHAVSPLLGRAWNEIVLGPVEPCNGHRSAAIVVQRSSRRSGRRTAGPGRRT
jgi:predicted transcriptional regulator